MSKKIASGFSLVETVLYLAVVASTLLACSLFVAILLESRAKNKNLSEVEEQGSFVMNRLSRTIRNSASINYPAAQESLSSLSLNKLSGEDNPTVFELNGETLTETSGSKPPINLTSPAVKLSNLTFINVALPSSPAIIKIQFTLKSNSPSNLTEFIYTSNFYTSSGLKNE